MSELLTIAEAAQALRRSVSGLRKLIRAGRVPAYRVGGRILLKSSDLDVLVESSRIGRPVAPPRNRVAPPRNRRSATVDHLKEVGGIR